MFRLRIFGLVTAVTLVMGGCASPPEKPLEIDFKRAADGPAFTTGPEFGSGEPEVRRARGFVQRGSGRFAGAVAASQAGWVASEGGDIDLDFESADLREVVKVFLGDLLKVNYVISDKVRGQLTLRTEKPVHRSALLPILESALQMAGVALVTSPGGYMIVPLTDAGQQGLAPRLDPLLPGASSFRLQVVPLRYVSATALKPAIEPFLPTGTTLGVDATNNLFLVSGPAGALSDFLRTVELFDADWLAGMSFALYPLKHSEAQQVVDDLGNVFSLDEGPLKGMLRLLPIERLNAILAISKRPRYLTETEKMIRRFDQGIGGAGRVMEVYYLQHADAAVLAGVLGDLYSDSVGSLQQRQGTGGDTPSSVESTATTANAPPAPSPSAPAIPAAGSAPASSPRAATRVSGSDGVSVKIIADEENNALVVMATAAEHRVVQRAVRKLDIPRRQVLVEATIAEITLTDNLQYGLQWFLRGKIGEYGSRTSLFSGDSNTLSNSVAPGFSFSLANRADVVKLLFDVLASESKLKILSSPQVMVIDNKTANIRVGDQIPVITRSASSVTDPDAPVVNEVQFRDTGVLLQVTPQINAGGMVSLEINQEVSEPSADEFAGGNVSILQRTISSSVAVQSGETVILGGLIREGHNETVTGIPVLSKIPVLGKLFSRTVDNTTRTELVVAITPRVITNRGEAREASEELMRRMRTLDARIRPAGGVPVSGDVR